MAKRLSNEIEQKVIELYKNNYKYREIQDLIKIDSRSIRNILYRNKLTTNRLKDWSNEEIQFLKENYSNYGIKYCAEKLNRSYRSVKIKCCRLNIPKNDCKEGFRKCYVCKNKLLFSEFPVQNNKKYKIDHRCHNCTNEWISNNRFYRFAKNTMSSHRLRRIIMNFSLKELENKSKNTLNCEFCNEPICWTNNTSKFNGPSLERLDNNTNLNLENIAIVHRGCNSTKLDRTLEEFRDYIIKILPIIERLIEKRNLNKLLKNGI